jgi:hypothetical protein
VPLSRLVACPVSLALLVTLAARAQAVLPSEQLFPATTKGYVSTQDVDEVRNEFNKTQFGEMSHDPVMEPFISDLKKQIAAKLERAGKRLGIKWPDMEGVYGGETAAALIQPDPKDKSSHATALIVDITGKRQQADVLLQKIAANQKLNKATTQIIKDGAINITVYTQPQQPGEPLERSYHCLVGDQIIFADHEPTIRGILHRLDGQATDSLTTVIAFQETLKRCQEAAGAVRHHVRWFMEPFGYAEASRASQGGKKKRGTDLLKILQTQGFTAIQGLGGHVFFSTFGGAAHGGEQPEILHRTYVYAPPVKRPAGAKNHDKYDLAMRMLDFPNTGPNALEPQPWALPDVATYLSFNCKMREAFEYASTFVDAFIGDEGAFEEIWSSLESDPNGPRINIRKELLDYLGTRATLLSDVKLPIDTKSERMLALLELKNAAAAAAVSKTVEKAFKNDPQARKRTYKGSVIWEITQEDSVADDNELKIEGLDTVAFVSTETTAAGAAPAGAENAEPAPPAKAGQKAKGKAAPVPNNNQGNGTLPNMAVTVILDHLVVSTHVDYIQDFIDHQQKVASGEATSLAQEKDYQRVQPVLLNLGSKADSFHFFTRTDESYRATYELFKQGKLPEAETMFARILNAVLGPQEEGTVRKQELDGSKLPNFDLVKKYLGPGGLFTQSEQDGWWLVGCLLKKELEPTTESRREAPAQARNASEETSTKR